MMLTEQSLKTIDTAQDDRRQAIAMHVREILKLIGENANRDGLQDTPIRVAKMYEEVLGGMQIDAESILSTTFEDTTAGPVIVSDITFYSLCEHHMVPFFGTAHVAYLPGDRIVGISKIARLVDAFARRLQVQERMTEQIVQTIHDVLEPKGVIALIQAEHTCMCARGIKKPGSKTTTLASRGLYDENYDLRREFLQMIGRT